MGLRIKPSFLNYGRWIGAILLAAVFSPSFVWARGDVVPGSRYTSAEVAALGDAGAPLGDDGAHALFVNPAAWGKIRGTHLETFNFIGNLNSEFVNIVNGKTLYFWDLEQYMTELRAKPGVFPGISGAYAPSFSTRGFGFGALVHREVRASYNARSVNYRTQYIFAPSIGVGLRLAAGIIRLGYSLQYVNKAEGDLTVSENAVPLAWNSGLAEGSALSHNVALAFTLPITFLPALNVIARNVGGARYSAFTLLPQADNVTGPPETEAMSIDATLNAMIKFGKGIHGHMMVAARDATNTSQMSWLVRAAFGAELQYRERIFLRAGFGSGYPSVGVGIRGRRAELHLAWYSEEIGTGFMDVRDQRWMVQWRMQAF